MSISIRQVIKLRGTTVLKRCEIVNKTKSILAETVGVEVRIAIWTWKRDAQNVNTKKKKN